MGNICIPLMFNTLTNIMFIKFEINGIENQISCTTISI